MRRLLQFALLFSGIASAQILPPQINLSGNIGCQGFPCVNNGTLVMTDADHTMTVQETSAFYIKVTSSVSLTATRNLIAPTGRFPFTIENATTGGQSIQIIGQSGTGVTIPNGQMISVWNDGTNYVQSGGLGLSCGSLTSGYYLISTGGSSCANGTIDFGVSEANTLSILPHGGINISTPDSISITTNSSVHIASASVSNPGTYQSEEPFVLVGDGAIGTPGGVSGSIAFLQGTSALGSVANTVQISAPASVTAYNVLLPGTQGEGALTNDGSGNLSWSAGSGTVTSFSAPSGIWPTWLVPTVTNSTSTPSLAVAASAIPNSALANTSTTVNGQTCTLGSTCTVGISSLSFSAITSGTNTVAAMIVGGGASLNWSGDGTINASTLDGLGPTGAGAALTTGPISSTSGHCATFTGTGGQIQDAGPCPTSGYSSGNNSNGYWVKDPAGHIHQWGHISSESTGSCNTITFPTAFTSSSSISASSTDDFAAGSSIQHSISVSTAHSCTPISTTTMQDWVSSSGNGAWWTADGY